MIPLGNIRILIVDDEEMLRDIMAEELRTAGYQVDVAEDPSSALEVLKKNPVQLILCDLQMPGGGGLSFFKRLREGKISDAPGVLVTGSEGPEESVRRALGIVDILAKPFGNEDMIAKIRGLTSS